MSKNNWRLNAACKGKETNWFYPETGVKGYAKQIADVKAFCRVCQVSQDCLEYALEKGETFGIWGGMTLKERNNYLKSKNNPVKHISIKVVKPHANRKI